MVEQLFDRVKLLRYTRTRPLLDLVQLLQPRPQPVGNPPRRPPFSYTK